MAIETVAQLEALVAEYQRRAKKYARRAGATLVLAQVLCDGPRRWRADYEAIYHDGHLCAMTCNCPDRRTPRAALRFAYRNFCRQVRAEMVRKESE